MQALELEAEPRDALGKSASRRLRRSGRVPGVVYGANKEAQAISLSHDDLQHRLEHESFYSSILTMKIKNKSEKVVIKDLQRHPCKPRFLHIDFQRIDDKQRITMRVPVHFTNEDKCVGVKTGGGIVSRILTELEVNCLPKHLPEYIEVDLAQVDVGDSVPLSDVKLPEGVELYALQRGGDASSPVVSVHLPRVAEEEEELEAAAAEELAAAEAAPEAAAPADADAAEADKGE